MKYNCALLFSQYSNLAKGKKVVTPQIEMSLFFCKFTK